ncbi:MAG: transcriptional regulator, partial [Owenweeksia sp.]
VVEGNPESVQKALYYYRKAYELAESLDHTLLVSSMLNNIGIVYLATDRLDSAEYYFLRADSVYRNGDLPFNDLVMAINNNLADVAIRRNQYNEAISRLRENKNFTTYKGQPINEGIRAKRQARATSAITRVYLLKNKPDSASIVLKDFPQGTLNLLAPTEREELEAEYLYVKLLLAAATQNWAAYHSAQQVWESYRDSIQGRRTEAFATFTDAILNLQLVSAEQKLVMQEEVFTSKIERDRLTWFSIFIVCLLIIVLVGFRLSVVRNKAKRLKVEQELYRSELENAALKKEKLEARIKYQGADLGELSAELMLMRNLNNLAREKLREIKDLKPAEQTRNLQELDKSLAMSINLNKSRGLIHQHLEKVNTAFYSRLNKASVDKLSKGEQEVAALIRVRLSDAEIAELRATSVNAVYVARHRLKKKLGLSAQQNLEDFLRNV